jgi:hypothetical protein
MQTPKSATRPPLDWEKAGPLKVRQFLSDPADAAWLKSEIARLPTGLAAATPEEYRAMVALLLAQIKPLRQRVGHYDAMPESLKEAASMQHLYEWALRHRATGKPMPKPARDRRDHKWNSAEAANRAGRYPWLTPQHRGPDLRRALCYAKRQFGRLVQQYRLSPTKRGREYIFTSPEALQLLAHHLNSRTGRSREIASQIWESIADRIFHDKLLAVELAKLRRILKTTGCKCALGADGLPELPSV